MGIPAGGGNRYRSPKTLDVNLWRYSNLCILAVVYYKSTIGPIVY
jgi:hypothetical protein